MSQAPRWSQNRTVRQTLRRGSPPVGGPRQKIIRSTIPQSNRSSGEDEEERKTSVQHAAPSEHCALYTQTHPVSTCYLNLTMVATFISGITASLLQISVDDTDSPLAIGVNTFLFSSLTFSIASAIYSLLVVVWLGSMTCVFQSLASDLLLDMAINDRRGPTAHMPLWLSTCIYKVPMVLLIGSPVLSAAALCLLVFSSSQVMLQIISLHLRLLN